MIQRWRDRAACRGYPTDWWFPTADRIPTKKHTTEALALCAVCPVRANCLEFALQFPSHELPGIWGGLSGRQRRFLYQERLYHHGRQP